MSVKSWTCKGCTNYCFRMIPGGEVAKYCRPLMEGRHRTKWITDDFIDCLDKTTDPAATENEIKMHEEFLKGGWA